MDDLDLVREAYGPVAPDHQMKARIRTRLAHESARTTRRRLPRLRTITIVGVATAAAAAVGIAVLGGGSSARQTPPTTRLTARSILLAAASRAAAEPQGRYWRLHMITGSTGRVEGANPYTVLSPTEFVGWLAVSAQDTDFTFQREMPAKPLSAADKAAWEKAGSPTSFRIRNNDDFSTVKSTQGPWTVQRATPANKKQAAQMCASSPQLKVKCGGHLSWDQRQRLAHDPKKFEQLLFPKTLPNETLSPANKLQQGFDFLIEQPASPAIRSKAFDVLADLPGVKAAGTAKGPDGRTGIAITAQGQMNDGSGVTFDYQMIIDPKTYKIVGDRETVASGTYRGLGPGTVLYQDSVLQAGWTSETPHHS
jgi:hypothetical protein